MKDEQRNFIIAIALSMAIIVGWQMFFAPKPKAPLTGQATTSQGQPPAPRDAGQAGAAPGELPAAAKAAAGATTAAPAAETSPVSRQQALKASPRVAVDTPSLKGSINLKGGRIDDLVLKKYRETIEPDSPNIVLLKPEGLKDAYFVETGWAPPAGGGLKLPTPQTVWKLEKGEALSVNSPVTLVWDNGEGLVFRRTYAVDEHYMFTVTQRVENHTGKPVTLFPYARAQRHGIPKRRKFFILHEGFVGVLGDELQEYTYKDLQKDEDGAVSFDSKGGWLGITDKYWAVTVLPARQDVPLTGRFLRFARNGRDVYQSDFLMKNGVTVPDGGAAAVDMRVFAGAKEVAIVDGYEKKYGIPRFELLIDWGWFHFITKPMFWLLHYLYLFLGNYGLAILAATVLIKLVLFPLSNKSYASMAKMKQLQPELMRLRELYKDDPLQQQKAMMELYRKHQVSPMSGCLPMVVQVPIFFALYKVLFVTIDMRHQPFCCWIRDLSAPDPTSVFNLFGFIPWDPPAFLHIGVLPLLMGLTMWVQMKLNPPPPDPMQKRLFDLMPIFFTFLLAPFPAGLVLYWTWNNILSIIQQYYIMKKHGAEIHLWQNLKESLGFLSRKKT